MKKLAVIGLLLVMILQAFPMNAKAASLGYGVFIGMDSSQIKKLVGYSEVVIDASYYTKSQIDYLHKNGVKVYSYLNVGSIENFRSYYNDFVAITLGDYENWPDEKWVDVSNKAWQDYVVNVLAKELKAKGVDGFFIDNVDVYSNYKEENIFNGLVQILTRLNSTYKLPVIVNGGYDFFTAAMDKNIPLRSLVYGVNTESVYTSINFDNNTFIQNPVQDRQYALDYLSLLKSKGLNIYVIEYTKNTTLKNTFTKYYNKVGYNCYSASSIGLT